MDSTVSIDPIGRSEVRTETLGLKRQLTNGFESFDNELGHKKAKFDNKDVKLDVKRVAEIVLVLATMGRMRGGRKPSEVEVKMMREARAKLADVVCKEFAPKDVFPRDGFGSVIEDLGLNRLGDDQKLGVRSSKLTISEKVLVTKRKMEKSEVFPLHSNMYAPPRLQSKVSGATESRGTSSSVRIFPSDKANHSPVSSGSFQHPPNVAHASAANSRTLPYQLPTSEVRPGGSNSLRSGRDYSSVTRSRTERPHFRIDGGANGSYPSQSQGAAILSGEHMAGKTPARSMQSQSASVAKGVVDKVLAHGSVKAEGSSDLTTARVSGQGITSKPSITQVPPNPMITNQHRTIPGPSLADTHREVSKIVQKLLHRYLLKHSTWTPPSRDYMSKALTCQMCKAIINEVDTTVVCDACERGYHLRCLQSNPKSIPRGEWQEWHCAKCLAISNGKPLPPKYGRVMRNISTPKLYSNFVVDQPSPNKKMQSSDVNVSQQTTTTNGITGNDSKLTEVQLNQNQECREDKAPDNTCVSSLVEGSNDEKLKIVSESQPPANLEENHHGDNHKIARSITDMLAKQSQKSNLLSKVPEISPNGAIEEDAQGESRTSEIGIVVGEQEGQSSSSMHEVEWVGGALKEIDGKTYYQSCCIHGIVYKVKDYVLFTSPTNKYLPNKLQAMWEDGKTTNKWVNVSRCFFPDDLPEGVGRPCPPESNELYESNHESTLAAGLIHASCEVLPPSKFSEESAVQTHSSERGNERPKPIFLCKWFYDETKRLFRDVTC